SVTVSIGEESSGTFTVMRFEIREAVLTSDGMMSLSAGRSNTSSKVSPIVSKARGTPTGLRASEDGNTASLSPDEFQAHASPVRSPSRVMNQGWAEAGRYSTDSGRHSPTQNGPISWVGGSDFSSPALPAPSRRPRTVSRAAGSPTPSRDR